MQGLSRNVGSQRQRSEDAFRITWNMKDTVYILEI